MMPAGKQHVDQSPDPGPIGRGPEQVIFPGEKIVREFHPRQMSQKGAVGVQRAFGRTGGAGGIDNQGRIIGSGVYGLKFGRPFPDQVPEILYIFVFFAACDQNGFKGRQTILDLHDLGQIGHIRYNGFGLTVGQSVFQGIGAEKGEQRYGHRPDLIGRNVAQRCLRALGQKNTQTIP